MRRIPFSWRAKVNEKLDELLKLDLIEKVEGPSSFVKPLVVVEKPNGDIGICLDMRQANQAIVREKHPRGWELQLGLREVPPVPIWD